MHVIYHCNAGVLPAAVAAALQVGALARGSPPCRFPLLPLPSGDDADPSREAVSWLRYGRDRAGHAVYALGVRCSGRLLERALCGLAEAAGLDPGQLVLVDTRPAVGWELRWSGWLGQLQLPGLAGLGRRLAFRGLRRAYPRLVALVERVEASLPLPAREPAPRPPSRPRVVYYCYGGVHTSVVAAAVHLGWLPRHRVPPREAILALPGFDRRDRELGKPVTLGQDRQGVPVLVVGLGPCRRLAARTIREVLGALGADPARLLLVPVLERTGWQVRLGGFLAQRLGWHGLGARWVADGIRRSYARIVAAVEEAEAQAHRLFGPIPPEPEGRGGG